MGILIGTSNGRWGRRKKEEGRRKKEEGRRKKEEVVGEHYNEQAVSDLNSEIKQS